MLAFRILTSSGKIYLEYVVNKVIQGYILCILIISPPPLFLDSFFSPTNKFAAGGAKIIAQKDAFLRPFPPFLM